MRDEPCFWYLEYAMLTMKEMCETIVEADILRRKDGTAPTAEQIFNSSPTGELFQVFEWYEVATAVLEEKKRNGEPPC